ncbi:MAG: NUDIX hydrolase [Herpetosiphonaceae bacterium]|nr:NUDIX hydrolase [Herpetosiphonaceae bacterium]
MSTQPPAIWTVEQSETLLDCKIFTVERHHSQTASGDKQADFYILHSKDWVNVIPVTRDGQIVVVEQFRHGTGRLSLETPGGIVEDGEAVIDAGLRELREETGYVGRGRMLGTADANAAFMTNRFSAIVVEDAELRDQTKFDENEDIQVRLVLVDELAMRFRRGDIQNCHSALAVSWFLLGYGPGV